MNYKEIKGDLFKNINKEAYYAHCVSSDFNMSAGIAVNFEKRFKIRNRLKKQEEKRVGHAVVMDNTINLITKKYYYRKPTYDTLTKALISMKEFCIENKVKDLNMPKIGCGIDRLQWGRVSKIIQEVFNDLDINITVYSLTVDSNIVYHENLKHTLRN